MTHHSRLRQQAFTLVELAVVLTIIALIIGGIMAGRHMVRSSEIQSSVAKIHEYQTAIKHFTDRYLELPGDFKTASGQWSGVANGNGNGRIAGEGGAMTCESSNLRVAEQWAAFAHLGHAGLISKIYTTSTTQTPSPGVNTPATALTGGGYTLRFCGEIVSGTTAADSYYEGEYGHIIAMGSTLAINNSTISGSTRGGLLTPAEARAIDRKYDDSIPSTGIIRAPRPSNPISPHCTVNADVATADYSTHDNRLCPLFFLLGF